MTRKISSLLILSLLLFAFLAMNAYAGKEPAKRVINPLINKSLQYAFPDEHIAPNPAGAATKPDEGQALGSADRQSGPGLTVGNTWYDYQHNGAMGRMIEYLATDDTLIHFHWMHADDSDLATFGRTGRYRCYNINAEILGPAADVSDFTNLEFSGYVGIATTIRNAAVAGFHERFVPPGDDHYDQTFARDAGPCNAFFAFKGEVPRALSGTGLGGVNAEIIWPKFRYVTYPGSAGDGSDDTTIVHTIGAYAPDAGGDPHDLMYFRGQTVGDGSTAGSGDFASASGVLTWTGPTIVDTNYTLSYDIAANENSSQPDKVGICWLANLPCDAGDADNESGYECKQFVQWDNDVYYRVSNDRGLTWQASPCANQPGPNVNVTKWRDREDQNGWRGYTDMNALITDDGAFHFVWGSRFWPSDANQGGDAGLIKGRIFHWSDNTPGGPCTPFIAVAHDMNWDQTVCNGGAWQLNASKPSISDCNGKLYVLFTQFNDIPAGREDDCAWDGSPDFPSGAANGDLYITVSADQGVTWDRARNITNTAAVDCQPPVGFNCESEHWSSMARFGTEVDMHPADPNKADAELASVGGATDPDGYWLDAQYINDPWAGGVVQDEGGWTQSTVKWIRIPCVDEVPEPVFSITPNEIGYPNWTKHGTSKDIVALIENTGNAALALNNQQIVMINGAAGDVTIQNPSADPIPAGVGSSSPITFRFNANLIGGPAITYLSAEARFGPTNETGTPTNIVPLECWVADTLYAPEFDTLSTTCLQLAVVNNGSFGQQGGQSGKVNMDYFGEAGECDTNATVYVYDGSPVILESSSKGNWSIFGVSYVDSVGFVQQTNTGVSNDGINDIYTTTFLTNDSGICIEKTYFAPNKPGVDTCNFIIQCLKIYSFDGNDHLGLTIGEAIDWDLPSDSGTDNGSGFDDANNSIWCIGGEYDQDDSTECQDNDTRYGGISFLGMYNKTDDTTFDDLGLPFGAYTASNNDYVYGNDLGFNVDELWGKLHDSTSGYSVFSSPNPDSLLVDLHMVMGYLKDYDLLADDTLIIYINLITVQDGGEAQFAQYRAQDSAWWIDYVFTPPVDPGCCNGDGKRGNVDDLSGPGGEVDVADLSYLVDFLFRGGPPPPCTDEGNVDALTGPGGPIDVADLSYLVDFLFRGGPPPPPCP